MNTPAPRLRPADATWHASDPVLAALRPYRLADLAEATGRSISGIRTAYTTADVDTARRILRDISAAPDAESLPASTGPISLARPIPRHREGIAGQEW